MITVFAVSACGAEEASSAKGKPVTPRTAIEEDRPAATSKSGWTSGRNGPQQQGVANTELPAKLELLWSKEIKFGVPATCAIAGGHVYVPSLEGYLYCLDRRTGDEVWKYRSIDDPDPKKFAAGIKAAPLVTADRVYTGDEDGIVHAIDRKTGKRVWTFDTKGEVAGGPTAFGDGSILVGSHGGALHRLKVSDGTPVWTFDGIGPINCSPPIADGHTFALGCESGNLVTVELQEGKETARMPLAGAALATPAIRDDRLYIGTYGGQVLAIDWKESRIAWTYEPDRKLEFHASCAVTEKLVFAAGRDKQLHCIDRENGTRVWTFQARAQINSSPIVVGDRVFVGSDDKHLYGVSIETGEKVFEHNLEETVASGPAAGEGVLVVGTEGSGGGVFCFGKK